jgi:hypothetical protein
MKDEKLKKLKRWAKTEAKKACSSNSGRTTLMEEAVWAKVLKRIEYYLHQKTVNKPS